MDEILEGLYGRVDWAAAAGLVHVAAIGHEPPSAIAIGRAAPASEMDRFVLGFSRARADVILTTGAILRSEPSLVHRYSSVAAESERFERWRVRVLGRASRPELCVLSHSGDFPPDHPALRAGTSGVVWTSAAGAERLGRRLGRGWRVEAAIDPKDSIVESVESAIDHLRRDRAAPTISVEAGPSVSSLLYPAAANAPSTSACRSAYWVEELLLSRFGGSLAAEAIGPAFVTASRIAARFGGPRSVARVREASGPWEFERYAVEA